jgi:hypothetical protein
LTKTQRTAVVKVSPPIEVVMERMEDFFRAIAKTPGLSVCMAELEPATEEAVAKFASTYGLSLPDELNRFWRRGLIHATASVEGESFAEAGFEFYSLNAAAPKVELCRSIAVNLPAEERQFLERAVPLTHGDPALYVDCGKGRTRGSVYHYSTRNPLADPVAPDLGTFLEHWLAVGCFASHQFPVYYSLVMTMLTGNTVPLDKNCWIRYYKDVFPDFFRAPV